MDKDNISYKEGGQDTNTLGEDNLLCYSRPMSPDRELVVWEKWIQIRKEETTKLGMKVRRPPTDLTMNLLKNVREDKERKTILEHAQIEPKPRVRGALFVRPDRLAQLFDGEPIYEVRRTRAEVCRPRVMEHIDVPKNIQETELGMSGTPERKDCRRLNADYVKYREKRESELKEKILKLDPFRPSISKLLIQGYKPKPPPPKIPPLPTINIITPTHNPQKTISGVYAIQINKSVWHKDIQGHTMDNLTAFRKQRWHEDCSSWTYYFNVPVKRVGRSKLFLHNLGTVTLRYCWKKIKRTVLFVPGDTSEEVFFFNKNEDVLSPGQCRDIYFTFAASRPGIYNEFWELTFSNICFFDTSNETFSIDLYADSVDNADSMKRSVEILKTRIHRKSLDNFGSEIINEIFDKVFAIVPQMYPYKKYFLEAQIFLMKNPVCFYHQTDVAKMKDLYRNEMVPGNQWDLSISSFRKVMISKQYDDRMRYYNELKICHAELIKPWYEGDELLKEKYSAVNNLLKQLANNLDKDYQRLTNIYVQNTEVEPNHDMTTATPDPLIQQKVRSIFYLHTYEHVTYTIEQCAGVLSSLDLNRWIEFDFCRS